MILYVDETENEKYFIVTGLLVKSEQDIELAYSRFKKSISGIKLSKKEKQRIYLEFKATLIDSKYSRIKARMLKEIREMDSVVLYSCYVKKNQIFKQTLKESVYITLLSNVINSCEESIDIVFDRFNKPDFEEKIMECFSNVENVNTIKPCDSQEKHGLQFADNACSVVRLHKSGMDSNNLFRIISDIVIEV